MKTMTCSESRAKYAETLNSSPENDRRLLASIDRLETGRGNVRDLVE